jgi:hypothetical protein
MADNIYGDLVNPDIVTTPTVEQQFAAKQAIERADELAQLESQQAQTAIPEASTQQPSTEEKTETKPKVESTDSNVQAEGDGFKTADGDIDLEKLRRQGAEFDSFFLQGLQDFAVETANYFLPENRKLPKASEYENQVAQSAREASSVIVPTLLLQGAGLAAGQAANARVGWALGQSKFIQWLGARGVEAGVSVGVGQITTTNEEGDNLLGMAKKALPAQWDFIPDSMATLDTDSPDMKKQKSINEDVGLGFLIPFVNGLGKFGTAVDEVSQLFKPRNIKGTAKVAAPIQPTILPETPAAKAWVDNNIPEDALTVQARRLWDDSFQGGEVSRSWDELDEAAKQSTINNFIDEGVITTDPVLSDLAKYEINQMDQLDELGDFNFSQSAGNSDVALRGVHDLYDWNEVSMRSLDDFGVVGASVDAARISKNAGTVNGRLGNMVSLPAIKYANTTPGAAESIVTGLADQLRQADRFSVSGNGWSLTADEIDGAGQILIKEMFDPTIDSKMVMDIIEPVQIKVGDTVVNLDSGYSSMFPNTEGLTNNQIAKAQAYLQTSLAGQVADLAESIRINGDSVSKQFALEKFRDRLSFMYKQNGLNQYYTNAKRGVTQALENNQPQIAERLAGSMDATVDVQLQRIQQEAEEFTNTIKWFEDNEPELIDAFLEMYELSDGRIHNINLMNESIKNSFTNFNVFWKKDPENAKNILLGSLRANQQNSMLSSAETASSALIGNLGGIVSQPVNYFAGAVSRGELKDLQRGWMAYSAIWDTTKKALPYAAKMFRKASTNPKSIASQTRLDLIVKNERLLESYKKVAQVEASKGNYGLQVLIDQYEMWHDMAQDPVFRFVPNLFTGFDGMARSIVANGEARFRAMNAIEQAGGKINRAEVKRLADIEYNSMFDKNGLIMDKATQYAADEIALNLDLAVVDGLNKGINKMPFLGTFIRYPTSVGNMIKQADDALPYSMFQKDINQLAYTSMSTFAADLDLVDDLLSQRGYQINNMSSIQKLNTIADLKNRVRGKKAIAAFVTTAVTGAILDGSLTGDGIYDKQAQQSRIKNSNWKARTFKVGDRRVEYEDIIGPGMANWVATYANIMDNFDLLGEAKVENLRSKMMFILGAAFTDKSVLSTLGPITEMLQQNNFAVDRWAAGELNSLGHLAGARGTASKIIDSGLREVNYDLIGLIQNRNTGLIFDEANRAPYTYNPVTGAVPNKYGLIERMWNAVSPIKVHPGQTKEELYLQEVEYDQSSTFATHNGVELLRDERSEGLRLMGEQGYWRGQIKQIMNSTNGQKAVAELRDARERGIPSDSADLKYWRGIHIQLSQAQADAEKLAFEDFNGPMQLAIYQRKEELEQTRNLSEYGIIDRK